MRSGMPRLVAVALISFSVYGCSKNKPEPSEAKPAEPVVIPTPKGLVAELALANPGETWVKVRAAMGGPLAMLPTQGGVLATTAFDLPPTAAELFDMNLPAVGALIEEEGRFAAVLAFHVKDGPKLAELATTGEFPRHVKKADAASGVILLEPKEATPGPAIGVSGNYLTVAARSSDLTRYAPFVTTVLPSRAAPKEDVVALATPDGLAHLVSMLKTSWEESKAELDALDQMVKAQLGPDASSADRKKLLFDNVDRAVAVVSDLDEARLSLSLVDGLAHLRLGAKPKAGNGAASEYLATIAQGDAKALLDLPAQTAVAMLVRDTREAREKALVDGLAALEGIEPEQKAKVEETLRAFAEARGDTMALGVLWQEGNAALVAKGTVNDEKLLGKAIPEVLKLAAVPAFAKSVESAIGPFKLGAPSTQAGIQTVRMTRKTGQVAPAALLSPDAIPPQLDIAWSIEGSTFYGTIARKDAKKNIGALKSEGGKLGENADIAKLVNGVDGDVAFALLVGPRKLMSELTGKPAPEEAPILVSAGRSGAKEAVIRIDMAQIALRDIAMLASGL